MALLLRRFFLINALLATSLGLAGHAAAQSAPKGNAPRPAFCVVNDLEALPVTAEVNAGKAVTKIQIPAGQHACCIKFCAANPAPSGYQISLQVQPAGGKLQQLCKANLATGTALRVSGTPAQARCDQARL